MNKSAKNKAIDYLNDSIFKLSILINENQFEIDNILNKAKASLNNQISNLEKIKNGT